MAKMSGFNPKIDTLISSVDKFDEKIKEVRSDFSREMAKVERSFTMTLNNYKSKITDICKEYEDSNKRFSKHIESRIDEYRRLLKISVVSILSILLLVLILIGILFGKISADAIDTSDGQIDFIIGTVVPNENITEPEVVINLTDITSPSNLTADQLNTIISERLADINKSSTTMSNIGEYLVKMENDYKVNALFCLAVASLESGHGTSYAARNKNNLFGIMSKGSTRRFTSVEEGILYWGKLIREKYIDCGRTTISSIGKKYCAKPNHWTNSVTSFMNTYASYVKN